MGSTHKGKNLLPEEQILSFKRIHFGKEDENVNGRVAFPEIGPTHLEVSK